MKIPEQSEVEIAPSAVGAFRKSLRGPLIEPGDPQYETARKVYNGMIDKRPRMIARCADVADVMTSVNFARDNGLLLAIRGGGHNGAGLGTCDGGLVIDLSPMKGIRVDPVADTVRVEAGCLQRDVDHATHAFGLAVPAGVISTTGISGLTLGGGHGYLTRKYGLTIDNLLEADLVLADGRFVTASSRENPDLFWAIRGGGGNFGVVTSLLFRAHPVHTVYAGLSFWGLDQAREALRWHRRFITEAPEDLYGYPAFLPVPPLPLFPQELHRRPVYAVVWCYTGGLDKAEEIFAPIRSFGPPLFEHIGPMPFPALQSMFDPLIPPGLQWYWKGDFVGELSDEAIDVHLEYAAKIPTPGSQMHLYPISGAANRVAEADTAFSYREANWSMVIVGVDPDPANKELITDWVRSYWQALQPYSLGAGYVNFMMDEGQQHVERTYRGNYRRLAEIKKKYDPGNLFRVNQNIRPAD